MGQQSKIFKSLIFFLTNYFLSASNLTIKSTCPILLTTVILLEMHRFWLIKILIFLNLILKIKSIKKRVAEPPYRPPLYFLFFIFEQLWGGSATIFYFFNFLFSIGGGRTTLEATLYGVVRLPLFFIFFIDLIFKIKYKKY